MATMSPAAGAIFCSGLGVSAWAGTPSVSVVSANAAAVTTAVLVLRRSRRRWALASAARWWRR